MSSNVTVSTVQEFNLYFEADRLKTFTNWPFQDKCGCTPLAMAQAGFYAYGNKSTADVAKCFFCFKELEGWEPQDDPWEEHRKHSSQCCFLKIGKKESDLTVYEHVKLILTHTQLMLKRVHEANKKVLDARFSDLMTHCT